MRLTLIIPCYNEAANLPALVERCALLTVNFSIDVILVDNGSSDGTKDVLPALLAGTEQIESVRVDRNTGYGAGILAGLDRATGDIIGWTHADLQTNPMDVQTAFEAFERNGSTHLFVKGKRSGRPILDRFLTFGMSVFETVIMRHTMRDINAQPTLFGRELFDGWHEPPEDFSLDLYAYWTAKEADWPIERIPVTFGARLFGQSHWNTGMLARYKFIRRTLDYSFKLRRRMKNRTASSS